MTDLAWLDVGLMPAMLGLVVVFLSLLYSLYPERRKSKLQPSTNLPWQQMPSLPPEQHRSLQEQYAPANYMHLYVDQAHRDLGPIFTDPLIGGGVFVADPDAIAVMHKHSGKYPLHIVPEHWTLYLKERNKKRGLLFMDGEEWLEHRRALDRCLLKSSSVVKYHVPALQSATQRLMFRMSKKFAKCESKEDIKDMLYEWSVEAMCAICFGTTVDSIMEYGGKEKYDDFTSSMRCIFADTTAMLHVPAEKCLEDNTEHWQNFARHCDTTLDIASHYTQEVIKRFVDRSDEEVEVRCVVDELLHSESMSHESIVRLVVDLFLGGADTTVWSANWLLYCLGTNEEDLETARAEVIELEKKAHSYNEEDGGELLHAFTAQDLLSLTFCRNVQKEAQRLYPVAAFVTRTMTSDCVLAGYDIPKDTMAIISVYSIGRDPKYFTNPEQFIPSRWNKDDPSDGIKSPKPRVSGPTVSKTIRASTLANMPFGFGTRNCVGRSIADLQLTLLVALVVRHFDVQVLNAEDIHAKMEMVIVPSSPLELKLVEKIKVADGSREE